MDRRSLIAGAGSLGLAGLAGCLGLAGLDEHEASPAGVEEETRSDTGYDLVDVEPVPVEESVGPGGIAGTVRVENYLTELEKAVELPVLSNPRAAVFILLTTPQVTIAGRNVNPVEDKSTAELIDLVERNYDDISDVTHAADDEVTILEQSTTESTFTADAVFDGADVDVNLHVTEAVEAGDDLLVAVGVYPQYVEQYEEANVRSLMESVVDDLEVESTDEADADSSLDVLG